MKLSRCLEISFLLIFIFSPVKSSFSGAIKRTDETTMINCFFKNLYNFSFREADSMVVVMNGSDIDDITFLNIKANLAWWKLLSGDSAGTNLRTCESIIHECIGLGLKSKKKDISSRLNIIYAYSLKARLENYKGNTFKSLIFFYKSIIYIEECINNPSKDERLNFVSGLYFYFVDYIENEYFMTRAMFFSFPKGDKIKGLRYLEECSETGDEMISTEANYFLMKIYAYTEKDYLKAYMKVQILTQQHPNNLIYCLEQYRLMLKMEKTGDAQIFRDKLIGEIQMAKNINSSQKKHFISQIGELTNPPVK